MAPADRRQSMKAWLRVDAAGLAEDDDLARWVDVGMRCAGALPLKP